MATPTPHDLVTQLAQYLTGPLVAHHSVRLNNGPYTAQAKAFFDLRTAAGLRGHPTAQEAERSIYQILAPVLP